MGEVLQVFGNGANGGVLEKKKQKQKTSQLETVLHATWG